MGDHEVFGDWPKWPDHLKEKLTEEQAAAFDAALGMIEQLHGMAFRDVAGGVWWAILRVAWESLTAHLLSGSNYSIEAAEELKGKIDVICTELRQLQ